MDHHFNVDIAKAHSVDVAIFLQNLAFWTLKNIANKQHFHDQRYWVYNTQEAYTVLFPYWSRQNIRTIVNKCLEKNLIIKGNYNKLNYDRTTWYSISDIGLQMFPALLNALISVDNSKSLGWNQPMERLESTNCLVGTNQPIPDNKPYNKHHIKSSCSSNDSKANTVLPFTSKKPLYDNSKKPEWATTNKIENKQTAKFWEPGNPDYDRVNGTKDNDRNNNNSPISTLSKPLQESRTPNKDSKRQDISTKG